MAISAKQSTVRQVVASSEVAHRLKRLAPVAGHDAQIRQCLLDRPRSLCAPWCLAAALRGRVQQPNRAQALQRLQRLSVLCMLCVLSVGALWQHEAPLLASGDCCIACARQQHPGAGDQLLPWPRLLQSGRELRRAMLCFALLLLLEVNCMERLQGVMQLLFTLLGARRRVVVVGCLLCLLLLLGDVQLPQGARRCRGSGWGSGLRLRLMRLRQGCQHLV